MVQPSKRFPDAAPEPAAQRAARLKRNDPEIKMLEAVGAYLESTGWNCIVAGADRIQQAGDVHCSDVHCELLNAAREYNFELVIRFTGGKKEPDGNPH